MFKVTKEGQLEIGTKLKYLKKIYFNTLLIVKCI